MESPVLKKRISVLGGGSWGATLASHLSRLGHEVALWEFFPELARKIAETRRLEVLPQLEVPKEVRVTSKLDEALSPEPEILLSVVPSHAVRPTFDAIVKQDLFPKSAPIVSASKGIEQKTLLRMTELVVGIAPQARRRIAVLSGPSHAEEVAVGLPTAVDMASPYEALTADLADAFSSERFRVYTCPDPIGAELGGALKNVYAIACGVADGLKLGDNAKAALMTRGLYEMARLGKTLGARIETFFGLSGVGDLIVTCGSRHSRNRSLGEKIGQGKTLKQALSEMTMVAEGVNTSESAYQLAQRSGVETPLIREVYLCLHQGKSPRDSLQDLLHRTVHPEMEHLLK